MKRIILIFIFLLFFCKMSFAAVSVLQFLSADDVTVTHLENQRTAFQGAINSADGSLIQDATITAAKLDANTNPEKRWNESFNDYVYVGLLPPTSANLTSTTTAGTAYINGVRVVKDATAKTYTANKQTFVDLSSTGTYTYSEVTIGGAEPSIASDSIRLVRVSTDSTTVLSVRDDRETSISTSNFKVGQFDKDMTQVNVILSYTGVGFKPKAILFLGTNNGINGTWGFSNATNSGNIFNVDGTTSIGQGGITNALRISTGSNTEQIGVVSSFDNDGFTINWSKTGSPTGTATVKYMAMR